MKAMKKQVTDFFEGQQIAILGYGKESQSSIRLIRSFFPRLSIDIWDEGAKPETVRNLDEFTHFHAEVKFKKVDFRHFDLVLTSPGIPPRKLPAHLIKGKNLYGQSELFLRWFGTQTIGITGTKGKSTTTSLIYHILKNAGRKVLLGGNIGVPLFDLIAKIEEDTIVVAELSCHQLNGIKVSPHIAVLLNLYEEHLDYYKSTENYYRSKLPIYINQYENDILIYNADDKTIKLFLDESDVPHHKVSYAIRKKNADLFIQEGKVLTELVRGNPFEPKTKLLGAFNQYNILPSIAVAAHLKISKKEILDGLKSYAPLAHRLQYLGVVNGVKYVNDSISTIPQATIAAVKALDGVGSLILGGFDRKIDYQVLEDFLPKSRIPVIVFFDQVGIRVYDALVKKNPKYISRVKSLVTKDFLEAIQFCLNHTPDKMYCLLSPAASSYGIFKNFEERGNQFRKLILKLSKQKKFTS